MKKKNNEVLNKTKSFFKLPKQKTTDKRSLPYPKLVWSSFFLGTINILFVLFSQTYLPPEVPLFYGLAEGQDQLANSSDLIWPGVASLLITLVNIFIASVSGKGFVGKALIISSFCISFLSLITVIKIIFLVGSF